MAYFRGILAKPLAQEVAPMTPGQYAAALRQGAIDMSIKLHKLNCCPACERAGRLEDIAELWDRHYHYTVSLALMGRHDMVQAAFDYNLETMQPDSTTWQQQEQQVPEVVSAMDLSDQQQELIAAGFRLFLDLQHNIQGQQQNLQKQMATLDGGAGVPPDVTVPTNGTQAAAASTCGTQRSSSSLPKGQQTDSSALDLSARQVRLEKQDVLGRRLEMLLFKIYCLRMAVNGWVAGCLTYEQIGTAHVLFWPHNLRMIFIAAEVMKRREASGQQRQQQRRVL